MAKKLTIKQKKFIDEYNIDNNAVQAYMRAGYTQNYENAKKAASLLMKNPLVHSELEKLQHELSVRTGISAEWVLNSLKDTHDKCKQLVPVLDKDGKETGEFKFDVVGALRAAEDIGKHLGMFKDKSEVEVKVTKKLEDFFS